MERLVVRRSRRADVPGAADLAAAARLEYERYSPVFWRRAADDRAAHLPFLEHRLADSETSAFSAELDGELAGVILASRTGAPPPFHADGVPAWSLDDFYVARPDMWRSVGAQLLAAVVGDARDGDAEQVVVVAARRDRPKQAFLIDGGYEPRALWWVNPMTPCEEPASKPATLDAVVGAAPPVYDPGGPVAFARALGSAKDVPLFEGWAAASGAVLAVVAARISDDALGLALAAAGYEPASEWFVRRV